MGDAAHFARSRALRKSSQIIVALVVAVATFGIAAPAHATLAGSDFESNDGNLAPSSGKTDWNSFAPVDWLGSAPYRDATKTTNGWTFNGFEDAQKKGNVAVSDSQFGGGVKQDAECAAVNTGSSPNKDDLSRIYIANKTIPISGVQHVFLALAWVRAHLNTTQSSTHVGFEFNQGNTPCGAGSDGLVHRTPQTATNPGDLLFVYDFASGTPTISVRHWVSSGTCETGGTAPCWGPSTTLTSNSSEAAVNTGGSVTDLLTPPTSGTQSVSSSLAKDEFGEAGIDLTAANIIPNTGQCFFFGHALGVSRSSGNSAQASMEDLVGPGPVSISNCATKTFNITFNAPLPAGTTPYAVYTTPDGVTHSLALTRVGNTNVYTGSDALIPPGSTLTNVHLEIRTGTTVNWTGANTASEQINGDTTNTGSFSYTVTMSPSSATNFADHSHVFTATVSGTGTLNGATTTAPISGITVNFDFQSLSPAGCATLTPISATTNSSGQASTTVSSTSSTQGCTAVVRAFVNGVGGTSGFDTGEANGTGTKTFVTYQLTVTPSNATNALGTNHTFTITLKQDTGSGFQPLSGATVNFSLVDAAGSNTGAYIVSINGTPTNNTTTHSGSCTTNASGQCTVVTSALRTGTFSLNATYSATVGGVTENFNSSGSKTYVAYRITVTPPSATNQVGVSHTFTITLQKDSGSGFAPVSGATLSLSLSRPAGSDAHFTSIPGGTINATDNTKGTCTTDANGQCTATIIATTPGLVTLTAEYDKQLDSGLLQVTGSATKQYSSFGLTITPGSAINEPGQPHTFTVTLTRNDGSGSTGYAGQTITLSLSQPAGDDAHFTSINGSPASGTTATCTTDANGQCSVTIVATHTGTVTLSANFTQTLSTNSTVNITATAQKIYLHIGLDKTACAGTVPPGGLITFTIPWSVNGSQLTNVKIVDHLQSPMLFASGSPTPNSAPAPGSTGDVTWNLGTVADGSSGSVSLTVAIDPAAAPGQYTNHAEFTADGGVDKIATSTITVGTQGAGASGEAFGATAKLAGATVLPKTPDQTNGSSTLISLPANPVIQLGVLSASNVPSLTNTKAEDDASATVANLGITVPGVLSVTADVVHAHSDSVATGATAGTSDNGSEVLGLHIKNLSDPSQPEIVTDVSSPTVYTVVNALGVMVAEVDVLEHTGRSGAALGGAAGAQPQGGLFSSGMTVNGVHVKVLQNGPTNPPTVEAIVASARSQASFPTLTPCAGTGPYVIGEANIIHEVLTYPTGPTIVSEGDVVLPSSGGDVLSHINDLTIPGLIFSGTGDTETKGALSPLNAGSTAAVQNLNLGNGGLTLSAVTSSATAYPGNGGLSGNATILKLVIGGQNICQMIGGQINKICTPAPNTVLIDITHTLKIELNEQIVDGTGKTITVNAVHIWVLGPGNPLGNLPVGSDLTISHSVAGTS